MNNGAVAAADAPLQQQQQQQQQGGFASILQSIGRMIMIYYAVQFFTGKMNGPSSGTPPPPPPSPPPRSAFDPITESPSTVRPSSNMAPAAFFPMWPAYGVQSDLYVYLSEDDYFDSFADVSKLVWKEPAITFGDTKDVRNKEVTITLSDNVKNNGTLYAHCYLAPSGKSPNPAAKTYDEVGTLYHRKLLTRYMKRKKVIVKKKLIDQKTSDAVIDELEENIAMDSQDEPWVSYWWNNITVSLVHENGKIPSNVPPAILKSIRLHADGIHYYPMFYIDDFWMLSENLMLINNTVDTVNVSLWYSPKSFMYYQTLTQMEESFRLQTSMLGADARETEEIKRMFLDTNPILLAITMLVSTLHSIFDFLAFKNDIQFWQNKKDMDGMSFRTIVINVAFQFIIFLYLLDNETSWMIIISNGVGLLIEAWKIQKTVDIKAKSTFPFVQFIDKYKPSKLAKKTMKYDKIAFKYLSYVLYPLLIAYAIYSVLYEEHKSWYSFVVGTLVGFVYMFGFISMTPQLFINYKLKSVAHMPWKTFMYKALNTFIDDLFAFVIKMPWLHRLACFRDDLIFVVYLYQRWIYPEDKRRRNEFGQVGDTEGRDDDEFDDSDDEPDANVSQKDVGGSMSEGGDKVGNVVEDIGKQGRAADEGGDGLRKRAAAGKKI